MQQIELDTIAPLYGGMCLSRFNANPPTQSGKGLNGVVFVKGTIPGEKVIAEVREQKRDYSIAEAIEILNSSYDRVKPRCPVYTDCGGCHYQHISYERQLAMKEEIVLDCLQRIGHVETNLAETLSAGQWNYRSKAQFKISEDGRVGFYRENSRDFIPIKECHLVKNEINRLVGKLSGARFLRGLKEIHIMCGNNVVAFVKGQDGQDTDESRLDFLIDMGLDGAVSESGKYAGDAFCKLNTGTGIYTVSPQGFLQANWELNLRLVDKVRQLLGPLQDKAILDVYGGAGNFSIPLAREAREVTVVEENPYSIGDGNRNILLNRIKNVKFVSKPFEKLKGTGRFDIAIVDPPRAGLSNAAMEKLLALSPDKIAYVSCNPSTFARDTGKLKESYSLSSVRLSDMFPNTYHCEIAGIFTRHDMSMNKNSNGVPADTRAGRGPMAAESRQNAGKRKRPFNKPKWDKDAGKR